ncbi:DUF6900 domain-containing protein [Paraburkholderia gardini]|jgi:hypothetical protein|uniref:DUF6900 domain-containing protein n=1 Tax=Paraburkholderia gardini TaxID=2823469 RepID=A0ABM8U684_9BURK|nr:hypothetical protein [Paraburkholderia gardini]CAG4907486.1 hypothetical protein R54767_03411 [Paraburkholderia gardini]CAG4915090.1 hypothetical protein R69919_04269 [Paraburkholderia gardini]
MNTVNDERLELLQSIAHETLGISLLQPTGKPTEDFRIISIENLACALEAAYDAGLLVGAQIVRAASETRCSE